VHTRESLQDLIDYTTFTWAAYGRAVRALPADAFTSTVPGSGWPSLRHALFHLAGGWDEWLRDRAGADDPLDLVPESIASWDELQGHREKVRGWLQRVLDETSDDDLSARTFETGEGAAAIKSSVGDILTHILMHERGHHGDISTILSQLGAGSPNIDYFVYLWFQQHARGPRSG
jgi:uncharacterized damage-inducible protein DinB